MALRHLLISAAGLVVVLVALHVAGSNGNQEPSALDTARWLTSLPRLNASDDHFQLRGVLNGNHLVLELTQHADGSRVKDARLEVQVAGVQAPVVPLQNGIFEANLYQPLPPEKTRVEATVYLGSNATRLSGDLEVPPSRMHWQDFVTAAALALAGLLSLALVIQNKRHQRR